MEPMLPPGAWTLVALPDTQYMSLEYHDVFCHQTEWIVANHGNRVHQILANYQTGVVPDCGFGGAAFMQSMHFRENGQAVNVPTYSP